LAAVYMLTVVQKVFFGPLNNAKNKGLSDINVREVVAVTPMLAMIFVIGFFPKIFLEPMAPTVEAILDRFVEHRRGFTDAEAGREAHFLGRRGGPLDAGYPKDPRAAVAAPDPGAALPDAEAKAEPAAPGAQDAQKEGAQ